MFENPGFSGPSYFFFKIFLNFKKKPRVEGELSSSSNSSVIEEIDDEEEPMSSDEKLNQKWTPEFLFDSDNYFKLGDYPFIFLRERNFMDRYDRYVCRSCRYLKKKLRKL